MSLVIMSARVHADNVEAVTTEAGRTLAAITAAAPDAGFAICKGPDGVTFAVLVDAPAGSTALLAIPAYVDFGASLSAWAAEPPASERWEVVGAYGIFETAAAGRPNGSEHLSHDQPTKEKLA